MDEFDRRLERMFAEAPALPDAVLFAAEVSHRLDRGQAVRNGVLALAGGAGAAVASAQLVSADVGERLARLSGSGLRLAELRIGTLDGADLFGGLLKGELAWTVAALAAAAVALLATRFADRL